MNVFLFIRLRKGHNRERLGEHVDYDPGASLRPQLHRRHPESSPPATMSDPSEVSSSCHTSAVGSVPTGKGREGDCAKSREMRNENQDALKWVPNGLAADCDQLHC